MIHDVHVIDFALLSGRRVTSLADVAPSVVANGYGVDDAPDAPPPSCMLLPSCPLLLLFCVMWILLH
jgi:hypothetical protein